jgi:hypothetical protein
MASVRGTDGPGVSPRTGGPGGVPGLTASERRNDGWPQNTRHGLVLVTSANKEGWSSNSAAADPLTLLRTVLIATLLLHPFLSTL